MKLIAAEDRKGGIGRNGKLLAHLPSDMKFFKNTTTGGTVTEGTKKVTGTISTSASVTASYTNTRNTVNAEATKVWK
ncbi:MAG: dihydrofolate reductase, partial [Firmicutes bacterium]|nr:dihydrofolate reductase [Bacillota bacterium]